VCVCNQVLINSIIPIRTHHISGHNTFNTVTCIQRFHIFTSCHIVHCLLQVLSILYQLSKNSAGFSWYYLFDIEVTFKVGRFRTLISKSLLTRHTEWILKGCDDGVWHSELRGFGLSPTFGILKTLENATFGKLDLFPSSGTRMRDPLSWPVERTNLKHSTTYVSITTGIRTLHEAQI
jgi:hypothetical protein